MSAWKIFLIICTVMFVAVSLSAAFPVFARILTPAPVSHSAAGMHSQRISDEQQPPSLPADSPRRPLSQPNSAVYTSAG